MTRVLAFLAFSRSRTSGMLVALRSFQGESMYALRSISQWIFPSGRRAPSSRFAGFAFVAAFAALGLGCEPKARISKNHALEQVQYLSKEIAEDVRQVRDGLPKGAPELSAVFTGKKPPSEDPRAAEDALDRARERVQDLRTAKSTFFAVIDATGLVIRNDQEQDAMAGKNLFASYPNLKGALAGTFVESRGVMAEAAGVKGREDAQWVAAFPVKVGEEVKGLYVTGWSWSAYAYRLENAVRTEVRGKLEENGKMPLLYAYMIVAGAVYGAPVSPDVNLKTIADLKLIGQLKGEEPLGIELEITGREFGLAAKRIPSLGDDVAVAVLRSET
jgi:hypothetical protein